MIAGIMGFGAVGAATAMAIALRHHRELGTVSVRTDYFFSGLEAEHLTKWVN